MINNDHIKYYEYLERLRKSGETNIFGAGKYLYFNFPELDISESATILKEWMENYNELNDKLGWRQI